MATDPAPSPPRGGRLFWVTTVAVAAITGTALWMGGAGGNGPAAAPEPAAGRIIQGTSFDVAPAHPPAPDAPAVPAPAPPPKAEAAPVREAKAPEPPALPPPAPKAPPAPAPAAAAAPAAEGKPSELTFATLAGFRYAIPPRQREGDKAPAPSSQIPAAIQALSGRKVSIEGYMIPMDFEKGKILRFVLSRSMIGCCFADSLRINEMIKVTTADGKPVDYSDLARVTGTLEVGEEFEDGYLVSLYRLVADQVKDVPFK